MNRLILAPLLLASLLLMAACATLEVPKTPPVLPQGFESAQVPSVPLTGYIYASQGQTTVISGQRLELDFDLRLDSASLWAGPVIEAFALAARFPTASDAKVAHDAIPGEVELSKSLSGSTMYLIGGETDWTTQAKEAIATGRWDSFQEAYPEAWKTMRFLPDQPPARPVAVGFLQSERGWIDSVARLAKGEGMERVGPILDLANVSLAVFALYSQQTLDAPEELTEDYIRDKGAAILVIAPSGYPSPALGFAMNAIVGNVDLEKVTLPGGTAYYREVEGIHILVKNRVNYLYIVAAGDRSLAEDLMASAISR